MNVLLNSLLMIATILLLILCVVGIRHKGISGVRAFSVLMLAMAIHAAGYGFELLSTTQEQMYFWIRIEYIGAAFYPFLILWFSRECVGERRFANRYLLGSVLLINIATLFLVLISPLHHWYYARVWVDSSLGMPVFASIKGPWYVVQIGTLYFAFLYALIVFFRAVLATKGSARKRMVLIFMGMLIPSVATGIYVFGLGPSYIDLGPFSYLVLSVLIASGLYRYDILFLTEVTHEMIFNTIAEAVIVIDGEGYILKINQAASQLFGVLGELSVGEIVNKYPILARIVVGNANQTVTIGEAHYQIQLMVIGKKNGIIIVFTDVTELTNAKKQLEVLATTDQLTKLYNRRYFEDYFTHLEKDGVVILLDIDHFKRVNDQYGHPSGDAVLIELADCLRNHFGDDVICRYGGEEFAVLVEGGNLDAVSIAGEGLRVAFENRRTKFTCTISIGICRYHRDNFSQTMSQVDKLLYQAKNNGRNCVVSEGKE
jgi:diguanylate cyclase (GGDEF)-like protein